MTKIIAAVCNELLILLPWNCFKGDDDLCNHSQLIAVFEATLVNQNDDKRATRWIWSAISLQINWVKLAFT